MDKYAKFSHRDDVKTWSMLLILMGVLCCLALDFDMSVFRTDKKLSDFYMSRAKRLKRLDMSSA